jgi:ABC-2 type transport system ATP-binding protein
MNENAIEIRGLEKTFPGFKLGPLDLTVPTGAIYGFIGPNGAGKTTTIDLIFGMGQEEAGSIRVHGLDHAKDEVAVKRQVGYVSPDLNYNAWMRVGKVIQFVRGFYPTWDDTYCERLMESLRLGLDDKILTLSFGTRIKLSLLLALSWRPKVLILDEPTVGLDAVSKQQVFAELLAAVKEGDRTVMISSHALTDLERFADHVGMIKNGQLVLEGATSDVIERFRLVDFITENGFEFKSQPGFVVQQNERNRWRVLMDVRENTMAWIQSRGAKQVSAVPVTLEELFVALAKE